MIGPNHHLCGCGGGGGGGGCFSTATNVTATHNDQRPLYDPTTDDDDDRDDGVCVCDQHTFGDRNSHMVLITIRYMIHKHTRRAALEQIRV